MEVTIPYALTAELTHRCPLHCPYCSNPIELQKREDELTSEHWLKVLGEASDLGVVQVHFTGGEPLLRPDVDLLIRRARELGLFVNLITSGVGLTDQRVKQLVEAGVDSIQLSVQSSEAELANTIAGFKAHELKQQAAKSIRAGGVPLHMNVVLHRHNIHLIEEIIALCQSWGAKRLELANTQYYGWALLNRDQLMPTKDQLLAAEEVYDRVKSRLGNTIELIWVKPDYYEDYPKPCMGGWGKLSLTVAPDGRVLPCTVAGNIKSLQFETVREQSLAWIWYESSSFNAYRGFDWMAEPCRSCDRRFEDFGGCRCQAYLLTGDARTTDPVCKWSPNHDRIVEAVTVADKGISLVQASPAFKYRGR
ncbi:MAG: pyrroloquinoline quinone biosynthesis protein PqqE [Candidatus Cohnella colombiensis]|uniref:PqqA peptide cyclase n=1 Tax=Candidatus Cohnella colombiensis TaxID=3121368 RepID=A0AA95JD72_9BACL|nr:MAG: pyrroloquinoline quinone biosynthesis protein PqqE [Cohnella sp.]